MGTQHQDVIEINGKKYDAVTGRMIVETPTTPLSKQPKVMHAPLPKTGVVLDGFVKKKPTSPRQVQHAAKTPQKSQTLMRHAVKKPTPLSKPSQVQQAPSITKTHYSVPAQRQKAAEKIQKNPLISRYGDVNHRSSVVKKMQHLPVKPHAPTTQVRAAAPTPTTQQALAHTPSVRSRATTEHLERALSQATAHQNHPHTSGTKKRRKLAHKLGISARAMALSTSILAGVLLAGFFAVQNVPNLSMRVAAARAGFDATMPGYKPSGFSFKGPINYSAGQVTVTFRSNTDDRSYSVTQKESNWNSEALLANFVESENKQYQTYIDRGRTLYIYDGSNATWVDNGVWFQIEGNSDMTTDQLVRVAASI